MHTAHAHTHTHVHTHTRTHNTHQHCCLEIKYRLTPVFILNSVYGYQPI